MHTHTHTHTLIHNTHTLIHMHTLCKAVPLTDRLNGTFRSSRMNGWVVVPDSQ